MNPYLLRQFWGLIEASQKNLLLSLDDRHLVHWLMERITGEQELDATEVDHLTHYARSHVALIRDLADNRG
jgi:succinate dehydrogenase flavin-adding protein (antitoxin of CptAB toxin-antitoxin module)